jgi:hypothetical protein
LVLVLTDCKIAWRNSRVEAKLDLLSKQANIRFDHCVNVAPEIAEALRSGKKIVAIKLQRELSGMV